MTHMMWNEWAFKQAMRDKKETIRDYQKDFPDTVRYVLAYRPTYRSFMESRTSVPLGNFSGQVRERNEVRDMIFGRA